MTKRILTAAVLAVVLGAVPASAQSTDLPAIHWEVVPGLANAGRSLTPAALADWRIIVRYHNPSRWPPHHMIGLANGQLYEISDSSFRDHINNYAVSPAAATEEWYER